MSVQQTASVDTQINVKGKNFQLKKDQQFVVFFHYIHHDPVQWPEPERYVPERFDAKDAKWSQTSEGKTRNPLAFTPFFGGKRVCLGKTFAEVTVRFTVPLIFHYLDFEFVNREEQIASKTDYGVGGLKEYYLPMKITTKNKV